jgi:hypothetical protein
MKHDEYKPDSYEVIVFDTIKEYPHGFTTIHLGMTHTVERDAKTSWMPQYRPNFVVTAHNRGNSMESIDTFGIKNVDAILVNVVDTGVGANLHGYGNAELFVDEVARVIGCMSKTNSAESDFNTGRITIFLKEKIR